MNNADARKTGMRAVKPVPVRSLRTFEQVISELAGIKNTAGLLGVTPSAVCHWRNRGGRFPAWTLQRLEAALVLKGQTAARELWDFDPPRTYDDDNKRT